jgi:antitoxin (DNA-binding transcriptional repressor) of toxin-antitoxin stability system
MQVQPISVKYLRENFSYVRERLRNGLSFLLIYRSEPIAKIEPVTEEKAGNKILQTLLNPPKNLYLKTNKSAVVLVRKERD